MTTKTGLTDRVAGTDVEVSRPTVFTMIEKQKDEIERALPMHLKGSADAVIRQAITALKQNPALAKCDPVSVLGSLMTASSLGLELGPLQVAHLVPYKGKAQLQIGYRGYIELAWRSSFLRSIVAEAVHEHDDFAFDAAEGTISHKWDPRVEDRGAVYCYYATASFVNGGRVFVVLSRSDIERYRRRSAMPDSPAWKQDYDAMAKKTCIRRLEPFLPKATEVTRGFQMDGTVNMGMTAATVEHELVNDWGDDEVIDAELVDVDAGRAVDDDKHPGFGHSEEPFE